MHFLRLPLICATCALLAALADSGVEATDSDVEPAIRIVLDASRISLSGDVSSIAHEAILRQAVAKAFPGREQIFDLQVRGVLPPGWALVSEMTLRVLTTASSGSADIDVDGVSIQVVATDVSATQAAAIRARKSLLPGMALHAQIEEVANATMLEEQCVLLFRRAAKVSHIGFAPGSDQLGTASLPSLDRLVQIATDCPDTRISITGHTDNTGNAEANAVLSSARAYAVAAYFRERGIRAARITTSGAGASEPSSAEASRQARQRNRRVGIELTPP